MQAFESMRFRGVARLAMAWLVICAGIIIVERVGWQVPLRQGVLKVLQPFQYFGMSVGQGLEFPLRWIEGQQTTADEVRTLKRSYAKALSELSELETLKKENESLRQIIEAEGTKAEKKVLAAPIISYSLTAIARGSEGGVKEGALVYVADTLIGRVTTVEENQSLVTLFSDPHSESVLVQTESGVQGLLVGKGKRLELTQIPVQAALQQGERITTLGQPGIPPGQFVGVVASVSQLQTAPVQTAVIDQLHSFYATSLVEVK